MFFFLSFSILIADDAKAVFVVITLSLIETPLNIFANRANPDQAALVSAV